MKAKVKSCPTVCNPMDCSPPGSSIQGIFQAWILEWAAISFSRRSSQPRGWTHISCMSWISRWIFYHCTTWETPIFYLWNKNIIACICVENHISNHPIIFLTSSIKHFLVPDIFCFLISISPSSNFTAGGLYCGAWTIAHRNRRRAFQDNHAGWKWQEMKAIVETR